MSLKEELIKELFKICDMEGGERVGWRVRRDAMQNFIDNHFTEQQSSMRVIDTKSLPIDIMDLIKEKLCQDMCEDLTTSTQYVITDTKVASSMLVYKKGV